MLNRRDLKHEHESAVLHAFKAHLQAHGVSLEILGKPEPPDAIVKLNGERTWIEITDAFLDEAYAISLSAGASHQPKYPSGTPRLVYNPDETFSRVFHAVIEAKYDKATMRAIAAHQGPGILLVGIFTPFATARTVAQDEAVRIERLASSKPLQIFESIYAYDGTGQRHFHILYQRLKT